jgi:hypothetical protein
MFKGFDNSLPFKINGVYSLINYKRYNMSHLNFFEHPLKTQNKEYFVHLVRIAKADDIMSHTELELLHRIGKNLGFTDPEIDKLIETTSKSDYNPPYELSKRFDQIYEIVKMTLADGVIDNREMRLASAFAVKSGFNENEISTLLALLIHGIKEGKNEEELFGTYRKRRKS